MRPSDDKKQLPKLIIPLFIGFDLVVIPIFLYLFLSKDQTAVIGYLISAIVGFALMFRYIVKILKFIRENKAKGN